MAQSKWIPHRRREQSWVLLLFAVILAVLAVVVDQWQGPSWLIVMLAILAGVGGVLLVRLKEDAKAHDARTGLLENSILTAGDGTGRPPTVAGTSLETLGVHEALETVPYLHRDAERELLDVLEYGAPALVLGPSMAGKTRMAAEMMRARYGERVLVIPDAPDGLAQLMNGGEMPDQAVIWLNDLDRYITDPKNLKGKWIDELTGARNIVIATMRESAYEGFQPTGNLNRTQWGLLLKFHKVHLLNDDSERQRLAEQSGDARIGAGISRYGVGAYIGGGFLAKERWESGKSEHPLGTALIHAAVDWRRSGIAEAIPQAIAEALAPTYLTRSQLDDGVEDLPSAISWATDRKTGGGAFRLLSPVNGGWRPFDYLLDHITAHGDKIPDQTWEEVARGEAPEGNLVTAGVTAYESGQEAIAARLFTRAVSLGNAIGMYNLGVLLEGRGETEQAEKLFRQAAGLGHAGGISNLGALLEGRGETEQAEKLFRQAAGLGHAGGMSNLGVLLEGRGETEQAEKLYRRAAGLGDAGGMYNLGVLLEGRGETDQAEKLYRRAAGLGDADAMSHLGALLAGRGETEPAEKLYRQAAGLGHAGGMYHFGALLAGRGETEPAEKLYRQAAGLGHADAMNNLGALLAGRGETEQAEKLYRQAAGLGNTVAMNNLGALLARRGQTELAEKLYRQAAGLGHPSDL
ncbi:tetratricopeptide repeat protein [Arthrobacter sp. MDT3-24]